MEENLLLRKMTLNDEEFSQFTKKLDFNLYRYMLFYEGNREEVVSVFFSNFVTSESDYPYVFIFGNDIKGCIALEKIHLIKLPKESDFDQYSTLPREIVKDLEVFTTTLNPMELSNDHINQIIKKVRLHAKDSQNIHFTKEVFFEIINFFKDTIMGDWEKKYSAYFKKVIDCDFPEGILGRGEMPIDMHRIVLKGENKERSLRQYLQRYFENLFFSYMDCLVANELNFELLDTSGKNKVLDNTCELIQIWLDDNSKFLLNKTNIEFKKILENCKSKKLELFEILEKLDAEIWFDTTEQKSFYTFLYRFVIFYFQHKMIRDGIKIHNHFIDDKNTLTAAFLEELILTNEGQKVIDFCLQIDKQKVKMYTLKYFTKYYQFDKNVSNIEQRESDLRVLWDLLLKTKNDRNGLREKDEKIPDELPTPCINLSFMSRGENGQYFDQKFLQFLAR